MSIFRLRLPLIYPFRTAYGSDDAVEPVLVRLTSEGHSGWGEAQAFQAPTYCGEYAAGVFQVLHRVLGPAVIGRDIASGHDLHDIMRPFKDNPFAKGAIDMAWWDLHARIQGKPLWQALGGRGPEVEVGADFGVMETIDALLAKIDEAVRAGFLRVKLKYAPGWELDMVDAVRDAFPDLVVHVDCNSRYTLDVLDMFKKLDRYHLAMIEQPLAHDDLIDHAALQRQIATPICLDESITSPARARKAIEIGACRWINIKSVRMGGHTPAIEVHDRCARAGVPCWVGGMVESGIGGLHCLAMATLSNIRYPSDVFPSARFFREDIVPEITLSGSSRITAINAPGIGVEPIPERLEKFTVEKTELRL